MSFLDITSDIGASLHGWTDQIANVFKGGRQSTTAFFTGPTIPFSMSELNRREMAGLSFGVFRLSHLLQTVSPITAPVAAGIAFAPALMHMRDYKLYEIGLNPERVLARGEWHRLVTSQLVNGTSVQLVDNASDLFESGSWLEKSWGWQGLVGAVTAVSALAPALYVALTAFAHRIAPSSALAQQYYSAYFVSPSMIALGVCVVSGYDKDVYAVSRGGDRDQTYYSSRYAWGPRLMLTTFFGPKNTSYMEPNICGILAGLICVYGFGAANPRWRGRGGLGWRDVAIQGALLGLLGIASYVSNKNAAQIRALN